MYLKHILHWWWWLVVEHTIPFLEKLSIFYALPKLLEFVKAVHPWKKLLESLPYKDIIFCQTMWNMEPQNGTQTHIAENLQCIQED